MSQKLRLYNFMPNTYQYYNQGGQLQQIQANTPEEAINLAPGRASDSGVQLVNPAMATTSNQWSNYNNATSGLNSFVNTPDPYMTLFEQQRQANALTAGNAIASATAATERAKIKGEQERNATLAGMATAAEKTGLAPNSAYQLQVIQGAQDQFSNRFALLDQQEKLAVAKAKAAQAVGDTAVLKEQLDYAVKLRAEKARALEKSQELAWEKYKFENLSAAQKASEARLSAKDAKKGALTEEEVQDAADLNIPENVYKKLGKKTFNTKKLTMNEETAQAFEEAGIGSGKIIFVQNLLNAGYSLKQIAKATGMSNADYEIISDLLE